MCVTVKATSALVIKMLSERGNPLRLNSEPAPHLWLVKGEEWCGGVSTLGWQGAGEVRSVLTSSYFTHCRNSECSLAELGAVIFFLFGLFNIRNCLAKWSGTFNHVILNAIQTPFMDINERMLGYDEANP